MAALPYRKLLGSFRFQSILSLDGEKLIGWVS